MTTINDLNKKDLFSTILYDLKPQDLEENDKICAICLDTITKEDNKLLQYHFSKDQKGNLGEKHLFHKTCLKPWLANQSQCPTCRGLLQKNPSPTHLPKNVDKIRKISKKKNWVIVIHINLNEDLLKREIKELLVIEKFLPFMEAEVTAAKIRRRHQELFDLLCFTDRMASTLYSQVISPSPFFMPW